MYVLHGSAARRAALALVPADAAEDIAAEAFARVMAAVAAGGGPSGEFRPYLLAVVRNLARDHNASRRRVVPVPAVDPRAVTVPGAGELAMRREELAMVARAFGTLGGRHRAVLRLAEVEEVPVSYLAAQSGLSANAVAALAYRARLALARAWERERGPQERYTGPARVPRGKFLPPLDTSQAVP
jgi:RNA polymerase sigma factor (sigma-70 family)